MTVRNMANVTHVTDVTGSGLSPVWGATSASMVVPSSLTVSLFDYYGGKVVALYFHIS